ncbi:alpha/beta hydrolase [Halobiforma nitratireducens]|uniref:Alpha/beta hydrolase fold-3 protein domain-containing protein n=1 Tax=Halobiforma nitratireducens JCM 10879 TaxID=1227454 RepID=M0LQ04_9EURY|nr:alpha/beta hydrolase [Halobiforma nitratireducens]EMA35652.1 alpha/beta hydrolase fold-3 protein domain-containing protein [Halobiforma nitratireducens JCM 10879]
MTLPRADEPHPDVQSFLRMYESVDVPDFEEVSPAEARDLFEQLQVGARAEIDLERVEDRTINGPDDDLPIRYYEPRTDGELEAGNDPLVLYFHGGGWVVGSLETHDVTCRKLAAESGYPVVSVDYRLAPEHPFPAALRDCCAALEWAAENAPDLGADPERIVVAGDSAGGNLAAATALFARDHDGLEPAYQLLIYPSTGDVTETTAYEENGEGYFLTADEVDWFADQYFADEIDRGNVYALPRRANDLSDLPPATVVTAGFDPLRDDGGAYADRLKDDGVPVSHHHYDDVVHGFFGMVGGPIDLERAHEAYDDAVADLRTALE